MQRRALSGEERQLVLFTWNSRTADYKAEGCLHHLVERVQHQPLRPAGRGGDDAHIGRAQPSLAQVAQGAGTGMDLQSLHGPPL